MQKVLMAMAFTVVMTPAIAADTSDPNSYVCVPDYATGFRLDRTGKWEPSQFSMQGRKFMLGKRNERWFWSVLGPADPRQEPCDAFTDYGFTECKYAEGEVLFNRKTMRFQLVHARGYVTSDVTTDKDMSTPPYYVIGKCSVQ